MLSLTMPTNKLWIEHTERAAWESVTALRQELAKTRQLVEKMAPPVEGWQELFDLLDAAKDRHALAGKTYSEILRSALEKLERLEATLRQREPKR